MQSFSGILDLSTVYGANLNVSQRLRTKEKGLMKTNMLGPTLPTRAQGGYKQDEHGKPMFINYYFVYHEFSSL